MLGYTGQFQNHAILRAYAHALQEGCFRLSRAIEKANPTLRPHFARVKERIDLGNVSTVLEYL